MGGGVEEGKNEGSEGRSPERGEGFDWNTNVREVVEKRWGDISVLDQFNGRFTYLVHLFDAL